MIYLDHNATTPLDPRVREAMLPWLGGRHGNPSGVHGPERRDELRRELEVGVLRNVVQDDRNRTAVRDPPVPILTYHPSF